MWYAVQKNCEDSWDYGSHDPAVAMDMLHKMRQESEWDSLIAVIDEETNYCVFEYHPADDMCEVDLIDCEAFGKMLLDNGWNFEEDYNDIVINYQLGKESMDQLEKIMME